MRKSTISSVYLVEEIRHAGEAQYGGNPKLNWIATIICLGIIVCGIFFYERGSKRLKDQQGRTKATSFGEIMLSFLASSVFASILIALPLQLIFHPPVLLSALLTACAVLGFYIVPARRHRSRRQS
jgi:Na+/H+ antiporter NhaD/arsenite permease-like protein